MDPKERWLHQQAEVLESIRRHVGPVMDILNDPDTRQARLDVSRMMAEGNAALAPLRSFGPPAVDTFAPRPGSNDGIVTAADLLAAEAMPEPPMDDDDRRHAYVPPAVWTWNHASGGRFANINRPVAGPTHDKELPVGKLFKHAIRRTVTEADNVFFTALTHNPARLHLDEEYCRSETEFGQRLVNSLFTLGLVVGLAVPELTLGTTVANLGMTANARVMEHASRRA